MIKEEVPLKNTPDKDVERRIGIESIKLKFAKSRLQLFLSVKSASDIEETFRQLVYSK